MTYIQIFNEKLNRIFVTVFQIVPLYQIVPLADRAPSQGSRRIKCIRPLYHIHMFPA